MSAILFGSISTLADTSELQRAAFNQAFAEQGLDWQWDQDDYRTMLTGNGGAARIAAYAQERGQDVDATAVHEAKSRIFQQSLATSDVLPREGVETTIKDAKQAGFAVGLVTTTSSENIDALFAALAPRINRSDFDVVVDATQVEAGKPDPAAYVLALSTLGETAPSSVAIEDNTGGVQAAVAAGVGCVAFPNENTAAHDFGPTRTAERIDFTELRSALQGTNHS